MYPNIDMIRTGQKLKELTAASGYDVKYIQKYLHLSCPQPIYRWFKGKNLPTVNHLYALSRLFKVHMEDMLISEPEPEYIADCKKQNFKLNLEMSRLQFYYETMRKCA